MSFYPKSYAPPEKPSADEMVSDYMKLPEGDHRIRILMEPIIGYQTWTGEGTDKTPHRAKTYKEAVNLPSNDGKIQEFHAFVVWDYATKLVRWLTVTQASIKEPIYEQTLDEDWADPTQYDIVIKRVGKEFDDTKYSVIFRLPKPLDSEVGKAFQEVTIDPDIYFVGGHPIIRNRAQKEGITSHDVAEAFAEPKT